MPETDQETTSKEETTPEDIAEEAGAEEESLMVAISRGAGVVVRSFSDGLQNVADAFRIRKPPPRKLPEEPLPELLQKLGELMEANRAQGYASLEENSDFWRLVAKIRAARRKQIAERSRPGRKRRVRKVEDAVLEGEPRPGASAGGGAQAEEQAARKKKKKGEESAAASGEAGEGTPKVGASGAKEKAGKPEA